MMNFTKKDLRAYCRAAFGCEYGVMPSFNSIILLESSGDGSYVLFMIRNHTYRFTTQLDECGFPIVKAGTIEKIS